MAQIVNAQLKEDVWLRLPPGVSINRDGKQHKIVKLLRALLGCARRPKPFRWRHHISYLPNFER